MIYLFILLFGLVLLVKGSDFFVKNAVEVAKKLGVSDFVIGLTVIAFGTSLPELINAINASFQKESGLILGNIVGANIANIALILGVAGTLVVIKTNKEMVERDGYILLFITFIMILFVLDAKLSMIEGIALLLLYVAYTMFLIDSKKKKYGFKQFIPYFFKINYLKSIRKVKVKMTLSILKNVLLMILFGAIIIFGSKWVVKSAVFYANYFGFSSTLIGILIAIGTTMPEMSVAVAAVKRGKGNIVVGNAIGSCITNFLLIFGVASIINPLQVGRITYFFTLPFFALLTFMMLVFIKSNWELRRVEAALFLGMYAMFLGAIFLI